MNANKVRLSICGMEYVINTSEEPDYVKSIAYEVETMIERLMEQNNSVTLNDAYMLCILNYADRYKKAEENADHIRSQLTEYLEDAARARVELDEAKRELERLHQEIAALKETQEEN